MIQALILVALVVIAVVLAPWLLGLIAMAVAAFGVYAVILGGLLALAIIAGALWGLVTSMRSEKREADPIVGDRVACRHCQAEVSAGLVHCDNCHARL